MEQKLIGSRVWAVINGEEVRVRVADFDRRMRQQLARSAVQPFQSN